MRGAGLRKRLSPAVRRRSRDAVGPLERSGADAAQRLAEVLV